MIDEVLSEQIKEAETWVQNSEANLKEKKLEAKEAREELAEAVYRLRDLIRQSMPKTEF